MEESSPPQVPAGGVGSCASGAASTAIFSSIHRASVDEPWPYFNLPETAKLGGSQYMGTPEWETNTQNFIQNTFMFVTMLSNFIPLSLYCAKFRIVGKLIRSAA